MLKALATTATTVEVLPLQDAHTTSFVIAACAFVVSINEMVSAKPTSGLPSQWLMLAPNLILATHAKETKILVQLVELMSIFAPLFSTRCSADNLIGKDQESKLKRMSQNARTLLFQSHHQRAAETLAAPTHLLITNTPALNKSAGVNVPKVSCKANVTNPVVAVVPLALIFLLIKIGLVLNKLVGENVVKVL